MGALQGRDNTLQPGQLLESCQSFPVGGVDIAGPSVVPQAAVFRPYPRVVQACRYRVGRMDLSVSILEQNNAASVEHAVASLAHRGGVPLRFDTLAGRFHSDQANPGLIEKGVEEADGVASAVYAGNAGLGKPRFDFEDLDPGLLGL